MTTHTDTYDPTRALATLRTNRAHADRDNTPNHQIITIHAGAFARSLAGNLPDIPGGTIGRVLLCAAGMAAAAHDDGLDLVTAVNMMAYAADNLIGPDGTA